MASPTMDRIPVRMGDVVRASHVIVGLVSALIAAGAVVMPLAVWKGSTDAQLVVLQKQVDRMEDKLDRLTEAVKTVKEKQP